MARMIPLKKDGKVRTWLNADVIVTVTDLPDGSRRRINTVNGGQYHTSESLEMVVARLNEPTPAR